jgi:hypothetical protein
VRPSVAIAAASFLLVFLVGCGQPESRAKSPETGDKVVSGSTAPNGSPPPVDPAKSQPSPIGKEGSEVTPGIERIAPAGQGKWAKTNRTLLSLAAKVGEAIAQMRDTFGESLMAVKTPEGNASVRLLYKIKDRQNFRVDHLIMDVVPSPGSVLADGAEKKVLGAKGFEWTGGVADPTPGARLSASRIAAQWPKDFTRLMFLGLTDGKDTWEGLARELASTDSGFEVDVEERQTNFRNQNWKNYRLHVKRSKAAAETLGPCEMEIVIDGKLYLPVTVRVIMEEPGGRPWHQQWSAGWNFDQSFQPEDFKRI